MTDDTRDMTKRQELLADYLAQLVEDKGDGVFLKQPEIEKALVDLVK